MSPSVQRVDFDTVGRVLSRSLDHYKVPQLGTSEVLDASPRTEARSLKAGG
jgi:hypothetical protein